MTTTTATSSADELENRARHAARAVTAVLGGEVPLAIHARVAEPADELIERSSGMDLMVLGPRAYGPPGTKLLGGVSSRVVTEAHCPTMILARRSGDADLRTAAKHPKV